MERDELIELPPVPLPTVLQPTINGYSSDPDLCATPEKSLESLAIIKRTKEDATKKPHVAKQKNAIKHSHPSSRKTTAPKSQLRTSQSTDNENRKSNARHETLVLDSEDCKSNDSNQISIDNKDGTTSKTTQPIKDFISSTKAKKVCKPIYAKRHCGGGDSLVNKENQSASCSKLAYPTLNTTLKVMHMVQAAKEEKVVTTKKDVVNILNECDALQERLSKKASMHVNIPPSVTCYKDLISVESNPGTLVADYQNRLENVQKRLPQIQLRKDPEPSIDEFLPDLQKEYPIIKISCFSPLPEEPVSIPSQVAFRLYHRFRRRQFF